MPVDGNHNNIIIIWLHNQLTALKIVNSNFWQSLAIPKTNTLSVVPEAPQDQDLGIKQAQHHWYNAKCPHGHPANGV